MTESSSDSEITFNAAAKCLRLNIPFALCHLPNAKEYNFFCTLDTVGSQRDTAERDNRKSFEIGRWLSPWAERITIHADLTAEDVLSSEFPKIKISANPDTTSDSQQSLLSDRRQSKSEYLTAVTDIAAHCEARDGKTVYSRVIKGVNPHLDITAAARRLFQNFRDSFGFLYYTPVTGCWLGASPEILLDFDSATRRVTTMALAGTRQAALTDREWDDKNLKENLFVADYICEKFRALNLSPSVSDPYTVKYGAIEHLRRDITATLPSEIRFSQLLDSINPTPALCGIPLDAAIAEISRYEHHSRGCYGGFVAIQQRDFKSFVNLRSARLSINPVGTFEIIAGGGIISLSDPVNEWNETEAKAAKLLSILSPETEANA